MSSIVGQWVFWMTSWALRSSASESVSSSGSGGSPRSARRRFSACSPRAKSRATSGKTVSHYEATRPPKTLVIEPWLSRSTTSTR